MEGDVAKMRPRLRDLKLANVKLQFAYISDPLLITAALFSRSLAIRILT